MTDVVEINDPRDLASYHVAWTALHRQTRGASLFNTLEWLQAWWRHSSRGRRLRVLVARSDGRPIGIVPLVEQVEHWTLGPVRVLTYPLDDWAAFYTPVGPWPAAVLTLAMRHLAATPRTWDVLQPRWTPHTLFDHGRTERAMRLAGLPGVAERHATTSLVECHRYATWDDYLASRPAKVRHEIRRQRRKLDRAGRVEHIAYRPAAFRDGDGDPRPELYNECVAISQRSWQANSPSGNTLCNRRIQPFLVDAHQQAARLGMLDLHLLRIDGRAAAFFYAYHCNGRVTGVRMGYDPAAPRGAGSVLLGRVIEASIGRGDAVIDLGVGGERYKRGLRTATAEAAKITHSAGAAWRAKASAVAGWLARRCRVAA